jgi:hypothetical protein
MYHEHRFRYPVASYIEKHAGQGASLKAPQVLKTLGVNDIGKLAGRKPDVGIRLNGHAFLHIHHLYLSLSGWVERSDQKAMIAAGIGTSKRTGSIAPDAVGDEPFFGSRFLESGILESKHY